MYSRAPSSLLTKKLTGPSWTDCWPDAKPRLVAPCMVSHVIVGLFATSLSRVPASTPTPTAPPRPRGDRKSTRLNSSHGYISYAVFCLKKKKEEHTSELQSRLHLVCRLLLEKKKISNYD